MGQTSFKTLLTGRQYIGIELFSKEGEEQAAIVVVRNTKEGLVIPGQYIMKAGAVPEKSEKHLPVCLVVNTPQVILKEVSGDASDDKLLHKAFPNLDRDAFYYEIWRLKSAAVIAVARKNYVDGIAAGYTAQGYTISGISLGVCAAAAIAPHLQYSQWATSTQLVCPESERVLNPVTEDESHLYNVNGLEVSNTALLGFSGVVGFVTGLLHTSGNIREFSAQLSEAYLQRSFFLKGFKVMLGFLLALLLVNFFVFTHYFKKESEISEAIVVGKSSMQMIAKTQERIKIKEGKVKSISALTSSKSSYILNEITRIVPSPILLSELIYNPLQKKIKEDESILYMDKVISISGSTNENSAFTVWVEQLGKLPFSEDVVITKFGKNEEGVTVFSIRLTVK